MKIIQPTLLVNRQTALANIRMMAEKASRSGVLFRPHFKTHQSAQIGSWFRENGVEAITVSSVDMAGYFARHGWEDISIAFPVNILEIEKINALVKRIRLHLLVESVETADFLAAHLSGPVNVWIKVDVGYRRTGISWNNRSTLSALTARIGRSALLQFQGLLTHSGQSYHAGDISQIKRIYQQTVARMQAARRAVEGAGFSEAKISVGDTPTCSVLENFEQVDEIRPGNFVFYDAMQFQLGVCDETDIALALACPVVAKHPGRNEAVIYGGAVHLSKDFIRDEKGQAIFGYVAPLEATGWGKRIPGARVKALSQEHGIIQAPKNWIRKVSIGDVVAVLPVHSCLTVNLMRKMYTLNGEAVETMRSCKTLRSN